MLLIQTAHHLFHASITGAAGDRRLLDLRIGTGCGNVISRYINIHLQQILILLLQGGKKVTQGGNMLLKLQHLGIQASSHKLSAQLSKGAVDDTHCLVSFHRLTFHYYLGGRHGHDRRQPCIVHHRWKSTDPEIVRHHMVDLYRAGLDFHRLRHGIDRIVLRTDLFHLTLVKIDLIRIFQKNSQLLIIQPVSLDFPIAQRIYGILHLNVQLPFVSLI